MKLKKKEIKVRLNDHDFNHLMLLVRQSNLSRESYLRMIINGFIDTDSYKQNYEELIIKIDEIMILIRQPTNLEELWQSQKYGQ